MSDLAVALSALAMLLAPCLLARAICISDRRAAAARYQEHLARMHKSGSWRVSTIR